MAGRPLHRRAPAAVVRADAAHARAGRPSARDTRARLGPRPRAAPRSDRPALPRPDDRRGAHRARGDRRAAGGGQRRVASRRRHPRARRRQPLGHPSDRHPPPAVRGRPAGGAQDPSRRRSPRAPARRSVRAADRARTPRRRPGPSRCGPDPGGGSADRRDPSHGLGPHLRGDRVRRGRGGRPPPRAGRATAAEAGDGGARQRHAADRGARRLVQPRDPPPGATRGEHAHQQRGVQLCGRPGRGDGASLAPAGGIPRCAARGPRCGDASDARGTRGRRRRTRHIAPRTRATRSSGRSAHPIRCRGCSCPTSTRAARTRASARRRSGPSSPRSHSTPRPRPSSCARPSRSRTSGCGGRSRPTCSSIRPGRGIPPCGPRSRRRSRTCATARSRSTRGRPSHSRPA